MWKNKKNKKNSKKNRVKINKVSHIQKRQQKKDLTVFYLIAGFSLLALSFGWVLWKLSSTNQPQLKTTQKPFEKHTENKILIPQPNKNIQRQTKKKSKEKVQYVKYGDFVYKIKLMPDWHYWLMDNIKHYLTGNTYCYDDKKENCIKYGRLYERTALFVYWKKKEFIPTQMMIKSGWLEEKKPFLAKISNWEIKLWTGKTYMLSWWRLYQQVDKLYEKENICSVLWTWWYIPTDEDYNNLKKSLWCVDFSKMGERCAWLWWNWSKLWWLVKWLFWWRYYKYNMASLKNSMSLWTKDNFYRNFAVTTSTIYRGKNPNYSISKVSYLPYAFYVRCVKK